jgi:hypothetical protein
MHSLLQVALLPLVIALVYYLVSEKRDKKGRKYVFPPGPRGLPIFGNFFQIPHSFGQGVVAKQWADKYGEMYPPFLSPFNFQGPSTSSRN